MKKRNAKDKGMKKMSKDKRRKGQVRTLDSSIPRPLDSLRPFEVAPDQLCWQCTLGELKFDTTDDLPVTSGIIGQPRAVDALNMALEIESVGYNVFVSGRVGTGRTTTVRMLLESTKARPRELDDKCYVNNFRDPDQPRLLRLPAGKGHEFRRDMDAFVEFLIKKGMAPENLSAAGYADTQPVAGNLSEDGRAQNRRIEIVLQPNLDELPDLSSLEKMIE